VNKKTNVINALEWRYATKKFDPDKKLSAKQLDVLLEALRLSPSSFGLEPWRFIVVTNPKIRARLRTVGFDQPQITDASHLIVFAAAKDIDDALIDQYIQRVANIRRTSIESLRNRSVMIKEYTHAKTEQKRKEWPIRQAYIALGVLLTAAALEGIDACPMEMFDQQKFDEILGLEKLHVESRVIVAVGFRSPNDDYAHAKKVRLSKDQVILNI
jgi:nitroreductase/dihydropteridine reductase